MTKSQLIELLKPFPDDLQVILYHSNGEDADLIRKVELESEENEHGLEYCKGDHPFEYEEVFGTKKEAIMLKS